MRRLAAIAALAVSLALVAGACGDEQEQAAGPGPDARRGAVELRAFGCGGCHRIPGIEGADGRVGPSLANLSDRLYIAGSLPVTPENVVRWIVDPKAVAPATLMPDLGVAQAQAADMTLYLYRH
jgi:cytochrome c2